MGIGGVLSIYTNQWTVDEDWYRVSIWVTYAVEFDTFLRRRREGLTLGSHHPGGQ